MIKLFSTYTKEKSGVDDMIFIFIGIVAFLLFILYDINSIYFNKLILKPLFFIGCIMLFIATAATIYQSFANFIVLKILHILSSIFALLFLILLIYTLFFALPFQDTYINNKAIPKVYDKGVYALCRHPGVLWFIGFYYFLFLTFPTQLMKLMFIVFSLCNVLYIIFQDYVTFPKTFSDYDNYKKTTPFLIPNLKSIKRCCKTIFMNRKNKNEI